MKKLLYLFSAVAITLTSCSSDDSSDSSDADVILLTKTIQTYQDGSTSTFNLEYSGKKLVKSENSNGRYSMYTYTGDLITKIEFFSANNILDESKTYTYDSNNRVTSLVIVEPTFTDYGERETFTYNADGTITAKYYEGNFDEQTELVNTATITLNNGAVKKIIDENGREITFTYDDKRNPTTNILGFEKLIYTESDGDSPTNNILTIVDSDLDQNTTNTLEYNAQNFPTSLISVDRYEITKIEYFYN
ncbi:hypothetical protein ACFSX9_14925 [Flavobacterium ardleyense]|uniref:YD repeat-containing protein n=1 Tax=Flavobacterium ardleyense TaxID=2038737 RepID=A0ABW5ZD71_9FLAO